eukprot:TRINITY_DN2935_c3_g1_i1.p1 TRINITY_DN2935_c3_g1~~TRINITY_DN2935_c3_g1_i1.p1  ORF type:complete len:150 (-),score=29.07 TRINITY_DN2935_c3_g1_i1:529-978(-)
MVRSISPRRRVSRISSLILAGLCMMAFCRLNLRAHSSFVSVPKRGLEKQISATGAAIGLFSSQAAVWAVTAGYEDYNKIGGANGAGGAQEICTPAYCPTPEGSAVRDASTAQQAIGGAGVTIVLAIFGIAAVLVSSKKEPNNPQTPDGR